MATDTSLLVNAFNDSKESWKKDHEELKYCWALEDKIEQGLGIFHMIRMADVQWSKDVQSKKTEFNPEVVRCIHHQYAWWLEPCDQIVSALSAVQKSFKVEKAEAFLDCIRIANRRASVNVERLIESVGQKGRGETVRMTEELWHELIAGNVARRAG